MILGAEGEKERDFDFLSSIELCIVDQAESLLMQNFEHVSHIFAHMNRLPTKPQNTDISRIRSWSIEGLARFFRQTAIFSSFFTPELKALFSRKCTNLCGAITYYCEELDGAISKVVEKISQVSFWLLLWSCCC
jgi:U3 small nucleolar RNA-associated protein 25